MNLVIIIIFALALITLMVFLVIRNCKDRKELFKKLPGDYPDPEQVDSEFDGDKKKEV